MTNSVLASLNCSLPESLAYVLQIREIHRAVISRFASWVFCVSGEAWENSLVASRAFWSKRTEAGKKKRLRFFLANAPNGAVKDCMEHETMHVRRIFFWIEIWTKLEWKMSFTNTVWRQCGLGIHPSPFTVCGKQPFCRPLMVLGGGTRQARLFSFSYKLFFVAKTTKEKNEKNESQNILFVRVFPGVWVFPLQRELLQLCDFHFSFVWSKACTGGLSLRSHAVRSKTTKIRKVFFTFFFAIKVFFDRLKLRDRTFVVCGCGGVPVVSSADLFIGAAEGSQKFPVVSKRKGLALFRDPFLVSCFSSPVWHLARYGGGWWNTTFFIPVPKPAQVETLSVFF